MSYLTSHIREIAEYEDITKQLKKKECCISFAGCVDSQKWNLFYAFCEGVKQKLIVTYSSLRAKELVEECKVYDRNVMFFPAKDLIFFQADLKGNQITRERMLVLRALIEKKAVTVITSFDALIVPGIELLELEKRVISISKGASVDETILAAKLVELGYVKNYQVEEPGQFSIRGDIIDIFDLTEENPYRVELWGDEVDSIRSFDIQSQRSIESLESVRIYPAQEICMGEKRLENGMKLIEEEANKLSKVFRDKFQTEEAHRVSMRFAELKEQIFEWHSMEALEGYLPYFYKELVPVTEYFEENSLFCLEEPTRLLELEDITRFEFVDSMQNRLEKGYSLPGQSNLLLDLEKLKKELGKHRVIMTSTLDAADSLLKPSLKVNIGAQGQSSYNNSFETLVKDLKYFKKNGYRILLFSGSRTRAKRLVQELMDNDVTCFYSEDPTRELKPGELMLRYGYIQKGFSYPLLKFIVLTEGDIFGKEKKKKKKKFNEGKKIRDFDELNVGDYVVHENHGLGIYRGIEKIESDHIIKDYMKIEYKGGDNLYILATGFDVIQKYASSDAKQPKLNKLGGTEWNKTKQKVREAVDVVAEDLVKLYAIRQKKKGFEFSPDTLWQQEFEETFPFEETQDQLSAIAATKDDMESSKIMDRLICGDVGYGKTEIAIRAAFKAVQDGKQVVLLVPTTILAQQHYNTFVQRLKDFPVRIEQLSRFRSSAEQKAVVKDLKEGMVDIVIGTHRVLSADVAFRDLGLLIVDEEQRFGVNHKEKIKKLKEDVDVLTLTATPIPRTLHMSLVGIRDMSVLEEAPQDRMPIQTYVMEYNDEMVREAIAREISRGGQVYYVFNRVNQIADIAAQIQELVPEANVAYAHGQMNENELEDIMYAFINNEIDVLIATTIIETGLDIPNVNTIIIHDSDNMGLSQLYQLRGRVGRSNRLAYAFLLYKRDKILTEVAEKRLSAIREFTDLGSGFRIAMKDLEIRGAGNLLGKKQHGHMAAVGYDLYCKMLNEAVKIQKGETLSESRNTAIDLDVDAYIPVDYIVNEIQKLDIYKRIAAIENEEEMEEMKSELLDRFGSIPESANNLLRIAILKSRANALYISELKGKNRIITCVMEKEAAIQVENIPLLLKEYNGKLKFSPKNVPVFELPYTKTGIVHKDEENLLKTVDDLLTAMEKHLLNS